MPTRAAAALNECDVASGRGVWRNHWGKHPTQTGSRLARLNHHVHHNAVEHGLVAVANRNPYGPAAWFERVATPARVKTVHSVETDRVCVEDDSRSQARRESGRPDLTRGGLPPL